MNTFLIQLGTMSLQASVAILVVLILRWVFAKTNISKKYVMLLWMIPFLLLICPWKISVPVGFWNVAPSDYNEQYTEHAIERLAESLLVTEHTQVQAPSDVAEEIDNVTVFEPGEIEDADTGYHIIESDMAALQKALNVAMGVWVTGLAAFLLYAAVSYALLKKKVSCCVQKAENVYCVDDLPVPMVVGVLKPQIYLPSGMAEEHVAYVVEHEKTHIRRKDPITKLAAYVIACVHWFNPLVWLAYCFLEKDMEMACDEETLWRIGTEQKKAYATALVQLSVGTRRVFAVPLAFGEGDTKGRIKNVMHYKKTVKAAAILAVVADVLVLAVFMTKQDAEVIMTNDAQNLSDTGTDELERAEQQELTFDMVREATANHTLHEMDFHSYSNGEEWYFDDENVLNYYIDFYYDYDGEVYKVQASHWLERDELESVYITRESDGEMRWLYREEDGISEYSDFLEPLLVEKESVDKWLSVELPEGYSLEGYLAYNGIAGGSLISPQAYDVYDWAVMAPQDWYYAGFVGKIPYAQDYFRFENGKLVDGQMGWWNHTTGEQLGVLDLDWQVLWMQANHDLYTASTAWDLVEAGIDTEQTEMTSDYWYFFFAKEGEDTAYYLSLSQKLFTKEEAVAIAETVDIKE